MSNTAGPFMKHIPFLLAVAAYGLSLATLHGEVFEVDGFAEKMKSATEVSPQHQSQWCWAASIQAVLASSGIDRSQEQIVQETFGRLVNLPAADPRQLYAVLNNVTVDADGHRQCVSSRFYVGSPSATFLKEEISHNRPVIMWYANPGGQGGHSVVVYKIDYREVGALPVVDSVTYFDPWPSKGSQTATRMQLAPRVVVYFSVHVSTRTPGVSGAGGEVEHGERVREIAQLLFQGKMDEVRKDFSATFAQQLTANQMGAVMSQLRTAVGNIKSTGEPSTSMQGTLTAYDVRCACQSGAVIVRVVYNDDQEVDGLWVFRAP